MGSDIHAAWPPEDDEAPAHTVTLAPYLLSRTPVTNAQYLEYVQATGAQVPGCWDSGAIPPGEGDVPVTYISFAEARAHSAGLRRSLPLAFRERFTLLHPPSCR